MRYSILDIPLRTKIVAGISLLVLVVSGFVYIYFPARQNKQAFESRSNEASQLATVLAQSTVTGLMFEDLETVENAVKGALTRDDLVSMHVYNRSGDLFYSFQKSSDSEKELSEDDQLAVDIPILADGENIGKFELVLSLEDLKRQARSNYLNIFIVSVLIVIVGIGFGLYLSKMVLNPLKQVNALVQTIAEGEGDLTQRLEIESKDEIGEFAMGFNNFLDKLHDLISQVRVSTERVSSITSNISAILTQLASGAEEQRIQSTEVATAVQEMTATILENSQNATQTSTLSEKAGTKAREGTEVMLETRNGMDEIVKTTTRTGEIVNSLATRASQIGQIIQVINDIADQTNLLALNAAIEAARAGEQGRGFAVVADEVRKLAERTTKATKEIAETIQAIQSDTDEAATSMTDAYRVVDMGKEATQETERVLNEIMESVSQAMDMVGQIAVATEEMSSGAEEISKNMESISSVTNDSARGTEQMVMAMDNLNNETGSLRDLMGRFKLNES